MDHSPHSGAKIGVFDSGVGGLSVLRALQARLPHAPLHYVADSAYAPYGDRTADEVIQRSERLSRYLLGMGAQMIVVACNTATTVAIRSLRARWPDVSFVGVEPGIKPAVALSPGGRIGVMATSRTVGSERLRALVDEHASHCTVVLQACPGLADAIEAEGGANARVEDLLRRYCEPLQQAKVDTVVLGCTHYPFVADRIQTIMGPGVRLVDTADAVALRAQTLWPVAERDDRVTAALALPALVLQTTGKPAMLSALARRWLHATTPAEHIEV